jgi:hypothetical protein
VTIVANRQSEVFGHCMFVLSMQSEPQIKMTMKQTPAGKSSTQQLPAISFINGGKENLKSFINTAWLFAHTVLWNNQVFSGIEISEAKAYIYDWLNTGKKTTKAFVNFCQRIILARQNVHALNTDFLCLPSLWLDKDNPDGYRVTKEWLDEIKIIRHSLPNYQIELRALSEAVLEFSEEPTQENFNYWRNYFIEREQPVLLNLFTVFCANQQFNIQ